MRPRPISLVERFAHCQPEGSKRSESLDNREGRDFSVGRVVRGQHGGNTANPTAEPHIAGKHPETRGHERHRSVGNCVRFEER